MKFTRLFSEHPSSVGESYCGHLLQAGSFGLRMVFAGLACVLHGLLPFLFVSTGSAAIKALNEELSSRRAKALRGEAVIR